MSFPQNGSVPLDGALLRYARFGHGSKTLIMLPGIGDGLKTVRGMAIPFALLYHAYANEYTTYMFSRREPLSNDATTTDMALDVLRAMDALHIQRADLLGVSMGGMIAQHISLLQPDRIGRLVLAVTSARPNPVLTGSICDWIALAKRGDHRALMQDNVQRMYTDRYYRRCRPLIPAIAALTKPRSYARFLTMARACLTHDTYDLLPQITAPTLVIGGEQDRTLSGEASRELAARIPGAQLHMYPQLGHSVYDEAPDFHSIVRNFLLKGAISP